MRDGLWPASQIRFLPREGGGWEVGVGGVGSVAWGVGGGNNRTRSHITV